MFGVIEGTGFDVIDSSFNQCLIGHARVERLWTGYSRTDMALGGRRRTLLVT